MTDTHIPTPAAAQAAAPDQFTWTPPGPGEWRHESAHCLGAMTPIGQQLMAAMAPGIRDMFVEFGMPLDTMDPQYVNGRLYVRMRPLVGADKPSAKRPPAPVLWLFSRLHPEMRRRTRQAAKTLADQPWRTVVRQWDTVQRPAIEARNLALQDVPVASLDDAALADHVDAVVAHGVEHWRLHFFLHGSDLGPIGMLLAHCRHHGVEPRAVLPALAGASPSTSEPSRALARLRVMAAAAGRRPASLDEVRAISPEAAAELDRYLRYRGMHVFSRYDVDGVCLMDAPEVILSAICDGTDNGHGIDVELVTADIRAQLPEAARGEFDDLLAEARLAMNLRDDNGPVTAEWPLGLVRRALVEAGHRLVARGTLPRLELVYELSGDEVGSLLRTGTGPDGSELERRAALRKAQSRATAPDVIGTPEPAPPTSLLPKPLATLIETVETVIELLDRPAANQQLRGSGVGTASYTGRVRLAGSPEQAITALEPGEVLVVRFTTPAYNVVLPLAGAIVTTEGGLLSHAAVLARELGLPAVVGAPGAVDLLADGDLVEVDPVAGEIRRREP